MLMALVLGVGQAVDTPARQAFVVEMVDDREDLTNAIGLNSTIFNAGRAIGPALAGIAVAATGEGGAFLINAPELPRGDRRAPAHAASRKMDRPVRSPGT